MYIYTHIYTYTLYVYTYIYISVLYVYIYIYYNNNPQAITTTRVWPLCNCGLRWSSRHSHAAGYNQTPRPPGSQRVPLGFHHDNPKVKEVPTLHTFQKKRTDIEHDPTLLIFQKSWAPSWIFHDFSTVSTPISPVQSSIAGWSGTTCAPPCSSRCTLRWNEMEMGT